MTHPQGAESPPDPKPGRPRALHADVREDNPQQPTGDAGGTGPDLGAAGKVVDALRASADQEFSIAERLSAKARQAFALAAGFFIVGQTVAFGSFEATNLDTYEKQWMIALAIAAIIPLALAVAFTLKADATYGSGDLPLGKLEDDLNAAYQGDPNVTGNLGRYYLGVVRSRREANRSRRKWYYLTLVAVSLSLAATVIELTFSLVSRTA